MPLYDGLGKIRVNIVDGSTIVQRYAADGAINGVISDSTVDRGMYHQCGAYLVTVASAGSDVYADNGSLNIYDTGGSVYVTCVNAGNF